MGMTRVEDIIFTEEESRQAEDFFKYIMNVDDISLSDVWDVLNSGAVQKAINFSISELKAGNL